MSYLKINKKGFTLIEIIFIITMMLILTTVFVSSVVGAIKRGNEKKFNDVKLIVQSALDDFKSQNGICPTIVTNNMVSEQILDDYTITINAADCTATVVAK